ncbi:MAG: MFS transporter, partial [Anaerolineae bacterium]|nr:MFS transporter [Anaerolineae bacterium]
LLVGGSLSDHFGRKKIYIIGILIFTGASAASGLAPTTAMLIVARSIQGIGGALMIPGSLAIISAYFDNHTRGKAIGIWSAATTTLSVAGPILGGFLAERGLWRVIFYINIPLAILAIYALWRYVPESYDEEAPRELDYAGALLVILGMAGITYGAIGIGEAGVAGFTRLDLMGALLGGLILLVVFIRWEKRSSHPLMPLDLFHSRTFTGANFLTFLLYGALGGGLFFVPLNLIQVQGYSATFAGFAWLPMTLLLIVMSPRMGTFVDKYGFRLPLTVGPIIVGIAFVALSIPGITTGPTAFWWTFFPGILLLGIGMGIVLTPLSTSVMGSVPQHSAGIASGINNEMSRSSQVLATSILGGLALILFSSILSSNIVDLSLPEATQSQIIDSSQNLGNTSTPDTLNEEQQTAVSNAIHLSFVSMFRIVMWVAAVMSWMSACIAAFFIEKELPLVE